jgi:hypothetical protein
MPAVTDLSPYQGSGPIQQQYDDGRVIRDFVNLANDAFGDSQTVVTYDQSASNPAGVFTVATPDGAVSVMGQPVSSVQSQGRIAISPGFLLLVIGAIVLLKK